jgi:hypothetical protein
MPASVLIVAAALAAQGTEPPLPSLTHWQPFATALAGASATLMGLLFVALSLNSHILTETDYGPQRRLARLAFGAFAQLLLIALLLLLPHPTVHLLALALGVAALVGLTQAISIGVLEWRRDPDADAPTRTGGEPAHRRHRRLTLVTAAIHGSLAVAAFQLVRSEPGALLTIGLLLMALLLVASRIAWALLAAPRR